MEIKQKVGIHNRFDIEVVDARTGKIKQRAKAENVILGRLWDCLLTDDARKYFAYIFYGSGSGTPSSSDTTLFNHVGTIQISAVSSYSAGGYTFTCDLKNGIASCRASGQLSETQAVGVNLSEVGIGDGTGASNLCTHAMLEDMNGNPITILKTNTDIINIYATVYIHWSQIGKLYLDSPGTWYNDRFYNSWVYWLFGAYKNSSANKSECYPCRVSTAKEGWCRIKNQNNSDVSYGYTVEPSNVTVSSDVSNKRITFTIPRVAVGSGNMGGIGSFWMTGRSDTPQAIRLHATDFYSGDNIVGEAVGTGNGLTKRFALAFDFPENAKIYVNGVEQTTGVTVRRIPRNMLDLKQTYVQNLYGESTDAVNIVAPYSEANGLGYDNRTKYPLSANRLIRNTINNIGFASVKNSTGGANYAIKLYGSNNLTDWNLVFDRTDSQEQALDATTGHYKYYKTVPNGNNPSALNITWNDDDCKAVVFDEAPANGAVITADYHTPYIAKDADHVFDFSYTLQFGEYTE